VRFRCGAVGPVPPKRPRPALSTLDGQNEWLANWGGRARAGRLSRAEQDAWAFVRNKKHAVGEAHAELIVLEAVQRTLGRVETRLGKQGVIEEVGSGFRGYVRTILRNELRRQLSRQGQARAGRQLGADEAVTIVLVTDGSRPGLPAIDNLMSVRIVTRAWPHRWDERWVKAHEDHVDDGILVISGAGTVRLRVSGRPDRSPFDPVDVAMRGSSVRIHNTAVVGLHLELSLIGWEDFDGQHEVRRPVPLIDSRRGIGMPPGGGEPATLRRSRELGPRRVAAREFVPCDLGLARSRAGDGSRDFARPRRVGSVLDAARRGDRDHSRERMAWPPKRRFGGSASLRDVSAGCRSARDRAPRLRSRRVATAQTSSTPPPRSSGSPPSRGRDSPRSPPRGSPHRRGPNTQHAGSGSIPANRPS
jgi:hypothetical protein